MKALVLWSSRTGNTKAVGKAIYEALPCEKEFLNPAVSRTIFPVMI